MSKEEGKLKKDNPVSHKRLMQPIITFLLQFIPIYLFWIILSGADRPFYLIAGALTCLLVIWFNRGLFNPLAPVDQHGNISFISAFKTLVRLIVYLPWLIFQIIKDNLLVAYLVLHPKMPINPKLIKFKTSFKKPGTQMGLANSITLSPGTITVFLEDNEYTVHMLVPSSAGKLISAEAQNRVGKIFQELDEQPPQVKWGDNFREISK